MISFSDITELPKTFLGESLNWGVRRIGELCALSALGYGTIIFIALVAYGKHITAPFVPLIVVLLIYLIIQFIVSVLLFVGASQNKPSFLKPWFWLYSGQAVLFMLGAIGCIFTGAASPLALELSMGIFGAVLVHTVLFRYFCQVVYAFIVEREGAAHTEHMRPLNYEA